MAKRKSGRRGKYHDWLTAEGLIKLEGWDRDGLTDEQIANNVSISPSTLYEWKKKYSEISEALAPRVMLLFILSCQLSHLYSRFVFYFIF